VDPNVRPWVIDDPAGYRARLDRVVARADVLKVSEEDLGWLSPELAPEAAARALLARGPAVVLLTRGGDGALVVTPGGETAVPVPPVDVVDTIGAGDAFAGGFLAWWHGRGLTRAELADAGRVVEATRFACLVAARTCARAGASPPYLRELG
jgi:fructokinase